MYMRWESIFGKGAITHEVTPVEPLLQRLFQSNYTALPKIFGKIMLLAESIQVISQYNDITLHFNLHY